MPDVGDEDFLRIFTGSGCNGCNDSSGLTNTTAIAIIRGSVGVVSFITCVFAIALFSCDLRLLLRFTYRLALYLVISAMFYSTVAVFALEELGNDHGHLLSANDTSFCKAAAFLLQYSDWIKLILTTITTLHLFLLMVFHNNLVSVLGLKLEIGCIIFSLVFPLLFIWYPFINDTYGDTRGWCWIQTKVEAGKIEQLALTYGPFSVLLFLNTVIILFIILVLIFRSAHGQYRKLLPYDPAQQQLLKFSSINNASNKRTEHARLLKLSLPLLVYPIVYLFILFFAFADRLYRIINNNETLLGLWLAHTIASASQGFFVGITLIVHLCLIRSKRSRYPVHTTPQIHRQLPIVTHHDNCARTKTKTRRIKKSTKNPVASEVGNTTHYQAPRESEVDMVILQLISNHDVRQHTNGYMTQSKRVPRGASTVFSDEEENLQERDLMKLDCTLTKPGYVTSDTGVTSDEEHETSWYRAPRESAFDDLMLKSKSVPEDADRNSPAPEQLLKVEEQLEAEGYGTSDTGGATSDEDITTWRAPQESKVDDAALLRKIV